MSPPSGSLPGFLSHSRFLTCLLSVPTASPEKCFLMVCFPHVLSAFLIRLGAPGGKNSIKATSSAWPRDPYTQVKPPALPNPQLGDAGLTRCLSMRPREVGRVSCERGVLPGASHPGEGQALTEETGTLLGRIWGALPPYRLLSGGSQEVPRLGSILRPSSPTVSPKSRAKPC